MLSDFENLMKSYLPKIIVDVFKKNFLLLSLIPIIFILFFILPFSTSPTTLRMIINLIISSQITVISIIFALMIFSSQFISGVTSPFMVRYFVTSPSIAEKGIKYFFCIVFELLIFRIITDDFTPNYSIPIHTMEIIQQKSCQLIFYNNQFFILPINPFHVYYIVIFIFAIISLYYSLSILREFASFFSDNWIKEQILDSTNDEILIGNNYRLVLDTLELSIKKTDFLEAKKILKKFFDCIQGNIAESDLDNLKKILYLSKKEKFCDFISYYSIYLIDMNGKFKPTEFQKSITDIHLDIIIFLIKEEYYLSAYKILKKLKPFLTNTPFIDNKDDFEEKIQYCIEITENIPYNKLHECLEKII